ncbi:hypothetical protein ACFL4G_13300 [Thermodesulfobacteriota bacterium]
MIVKSKGTSWVALLATVLLLCSACSGKKVDERDGAELASIMEAAGAALRNADEAAFLTLYAVDAQPMARMEWRGLQRWEGGFSGTRAGQVIIPPGLERITTDIHVLRLKIHAWFDFTSILESRNTIYRASWDFKRDDVDGRWHLWSLAVDRPRYGYDALIEDLRRLHPSEFHALGMEWEAGVDPSPLLRKALRSLAAGDLEAFKNMTLWGAFFRALDRNIPLPTVDMSDSTNGIYNSKASLDFLKQQIRNLREAADRVHVKPLDFEPYFTAYGVHSLPEKCTKLDLEIEMDGRRLMDTMEKITVKWIAVRLKGKWLIDEITVASMIVQTLQLY